MKVNFKSFAWQKDILDGVVIPYCEGSAYPSITVIKARRQCGKSVVAIQALLITALKKPGCISALIEPTWSQSQRIFKQLRKAAGKLVAGSNASDGTITLKNGSEIDVFSAGQGEGLRGPTVSGILIIDEAAYITDDIYATVLPWVDVHRSPVILLSTPRFTSGFYYQEYQRAIFDKTRYALYDWANIKYNARNLCSGGTTMVDLLPPDRLQHYRETLPPLQFQCDYEAKFIEAQSLLFGDINGSLIEAPQPSKRLCVGIDWSSGSSGDYTTFVATNEFGEVILAKHFNKGGALAQCSWVRDTLLDLYKKGYRFDRVYSETNNTGSTQTEVLRKELGNQDILRVLRDITMTNELKVEMVGQLQIAFDRNKISLVRGECKDLLEELSHFESNLTPSGKLTFGGVSSHDDLVVGLCYSWLAHREISGDTSKGKYLLV